MKYSVLLILDNLYAQFLQHPLLFLTIPVAAAALGWAASALALRLLFHPLDFIGVPPYLGWQGVLPRNKHRLSGDMAELLARKVLPPEELFQRVDADILVHAVERPLLRLADEVIDDVMTEHQPALWTVLPVPVKRRIVKQVGREIPAQVREVLDAVRTDPGSVLDVRHFASSRVPHEKRLLTEPVLLPARQELALIRRYGLLIGAVLGILELVWWILAPGHWTLPALGMGIGGLTAFLAIFLLFEPRQGLRIFGQIVAGVLPARHHEIVSAYTRAAADTLLTGRHITQEILTGPGAANMEQLITRSVNRALDERSGLLRTYINMRDGPGGYDAIKAATAVQVMKRLPQSAREIERALQRTLQVDTLLQERSDQITADEFTAVLRPVILQYRPVLVGAGALLGLGLGLVQSFYTFAGMVAG